MNSLRELGARLKAAREEKELELAQFAQSTGLPERYLQALEAGDLSPLPGPAYARMYFSKYARALGLDVDQLLLEWPREKREVKAPLEPGAERPRWLRPAVLAVAALVLIWLILWCSGGGDPVEQGSRAPGADQAQDRLAAIASDSSAALASGPAELLRDTLAAIGRDTSALPAPIRPAPPEVHVLVVEARTQTWVVIEADGDTVAATVLAPGQALSAEAKSSLILTVGRPPAVDVTLDDRALVLPTSTGRPLVRHRVYPAAEGSDS